MQRWPKRTVGQWPTSLFSLPFFPLAFLLFGRYRGPCDRLRPCYRASLFLPSANVRGARAHLNEGRSPPQRSSWTLVCSGLYVFLDGSSGTAGPPYTRRPTVGRESRCPRPGGIRASSLSLATSCQRIKGPALMLFHWRC